MNQRSTQLIAGLIFGMILIGIALPFVLLPPKVIFDYCYNTYWRCRDMNYRWALIPLIAGPLLTVGAAMIFKAVQRYRRKEYGDGRLIG